MAASVPIPVDPPPLKKHKGRCIIEDLIDRLGNDLQLVQKAIGSLSEDRFNALFFLKIKSCNGCTGFGVQFSNAFCETETLQEEFFPFYSVFTKGTEMLFNCLKHPSQADSLDDTSRILLARLLNLLMDTASMTFIKDLERKSSGILGNKTQMTIALAEHVFSKLTLSSNYSIDETFENQVDFACGLCQCGCKTDVKSRFGDTSLGEPGSWHGCLDVILGHGEESVPILISGDGEVRPGDKTSIEVVCKNLNYNKVKHRMISQAIVFSFLQKKMYPDSNTSIVPVIGVSAKEVIFFFYDCAKDVLMQSVKMPWRSGKGVRYSTLIAIWLAVNYKYLGSGLTGNLLDAPKSDFFSKAGEVLDVYKNDMIKGNVKGSYEEDTVYPEEIPEEKIVWPNGKPNFEF